MLIAFVITVFVLLTLISLINSFRRPYNYPPGPFLLPIFGNLLQIWKLSKKFGGQHHAMIELAKRWKTNVLGVKLGNELIVTVFSYSLIKSTLAKEEYEGRPDNFFVKLRSMGTRNGITCTDGEFWNIQKNFLLKHLRNLGFGKKTLEYKIKEEILEVLDVLEEHNSEIPVARLLSPAIVNILWSLVAGSRIKRGDTRLEVILDLLRMRSKAFDMSGGMLALFPWIRFVAPERCGYNMIIKLNGQFRELFMEAINEHHKHWTEENKEDDLMYSFITEMKAANGHSSTTFTDHQLLMVCLDLFIAGTNATSDTLEFAFLMMLLHQDIQAKVQAQLDATFDQMHSLDYSDRLKVPYIEAVLLEVQRHCCVSPVLGPRRVLKDTVLEGYNIPKDTTVLFSGYLVHKDKEYWGDPEVFRPERFLDSEGCLTSSDRVIPYGLGRRRCLGEILARSCIFLFFVEILRKYSVCLPPGATKPSGIVLPGLTASAEKYTARFIRR